MKRCSVCEFIYEEDQRFCDMDGTELATDPTLFQFSRDVSAPATVSRSRRFLQSPFSLAALSLLGVISSALVIGYYDFVSHGDSNGVNRQSVGILVPTAHAETPDTTKREEVTNAFEGSATGDQPSNSSRPRTGLSNPSSEVSSVRSTRAGRAPQSREYKRDSKVTKAIKKTGRFLSKPFKRF